jgi:AcrR family transcriptional regulator
MLYYHFDSKLALYREIVRDMLTAVRDLAVSTADLPAPADARLADFIAGVIRLADQRSWFPALMLREFAEGAPRLDPDTFALMKSVFAAFARILADGQQSGRFRPVHPVLAWLSLIGPILLNAARERAASRPGRLDVPMFVEIPHADLTRHLQQAALRLLAREA